MRYRCEKSMPSPKQLRYFLTAADLGGFTQAAAALFVAQPALSRQVGALEAELGFALFERAARGVRLTPAGAAYRERVIAAQAHLEAAAEEGRELAQGKSGVLRVLYSSSIPAASLLPALARFLKASPKARVELDRVASELQVSEVAAGRADVGVIRLPVLRSEPGVDFIALPPERLWVALPAGHALARARGIEMAQLRGELFVSAVHRERGGLARLVTDLCLRAGFAPRLARVVSRKTSQLELAAAGYGVTVVPERMTVLRVKGLVYVRLRGPQAVAQGAVVLPERAGALARAFAEQVARPAARARSS
jgi:DNA-binding transcriptional LysR family regulator